LISEADLSGYLEIAGQIDAEEAAESVKEEMQREADLGT